MKAIRSLKLVLKTFKAENNKVVEGSGRVNKTIVNLSNKSKNYKSKNLTYVINIEAIKNPLS